MPLPRLPSRPLHLGAPPRRPQAPKLEPDNGWLPANLFNTFYQVWGERTITATEDGGGWGGPRTTRTLLAQSHVAPRSLSPAWGVVIIRGEQLDAVWLEAQGQAFDAVTLEVWDASLLGMTLGNDANEALHKLSFDALGNHASCLTP